MNHRERIDAVVTGELPDRPAVSFWRHHYRQEVSPEGLADITVEFQKQYDWDFVKVNPRSTYFSEDWGNRYHFFDEDHHKPELETARIRSAADWAGLEPLDTGAKVLAGHLEALRMIRGALGPDVPIIMTVFTPLSIAAQLAGTDEALREQIRSAPDQVHAGLRTITRTFTQFARACLEAGCDGLYYATTHWGTREMLADAEFKTFSRPYDVELLGEVEGRTRLNVLHVCGRKSMLDLALDYPVQVLSWDMTDETNPPPAEVISHSYKAVVGGVSQEKLRAAGRRAEVMEEAERAFHATLGRKWILGAGCCIPTDTDAGTLQALRDLVERWNPQDLIDHAKRSDIKS